MEPISRPRIFSARRAPSPVLNAAVNLSVLAVLCAAAPLLPGRLELLGVSLVSACMGRLAHRAVWPVLVVGTASAAWFGLLSDRVSQLLVLGQWFVLTCAYLHLLLRRMLETTRGL